MKSKETGSNASVISPPEIFWWHQIVSSIGLVWFGGSFGLFLVLVLTLKPSNNKNT